MIGLILLILLILLLFGGFAHGRAYEGDYGNPMGLLGLILVIVLVIYLLTGMHL